MMTFKEFLEKQAPQSHYRERSERRQEWITAVGRLIEQVREWLTEADPRGVINIQVFEIQKS